MERDPLEKPETNTLRNETRRVEAIVIAHQSAMAVVLLQFRMAPMTRPFGGGTFNHLRLAGVNLTLCRALTTGSNEPVDLAEVDCLGCLDAFTEIVRP